eukprot:875173-Prorocentrum_minimum.AAC.1
MSSLSTLTGTWLTPSITDPTCLSILASPVGGTQPRPADAKNGSVGIDSMLNKWIHITSFYYGSSCPPVPLTARIHSTPQTKQVDFEGIEGTIVPTHGASSSSRRRNRPCPYY